MARGGLSNTPGGEEPKGRVVRVCGWIPFYFDRIIIER